MSKIKFVLLFVVLALVASSAFAQDTLITLGSDDDLGEFMIGEGDMTLYIFTRDPLGETVCYEQCAVNWPPLMVESADDITYDESIPGEFGTVERTDSEMLQVTYNGLPLYYFINDFEAGDANGQAVGNVWWVVAPADVYVLRDDELGHILVGDTGMTLYTFANDEMGVSNCDESCLENWPAFTLYPGDRLVASSDIMGEWDTIANEEGPAHITYNGMPLYYFAGDEAPGDTNGQGRGDVWWVVAP